MATIKTYAVPFIAPLSAAALLGDCLINVGNSVFAKTVIAFMYLVY